ncbi:hypothetical protein [Phyllobacterium zundukense]|uniref:DUF3040 domain-containing protein n=1 Tax=Phyllobacterium zundukense TaxID=1867719 RepID=A0A2N9W291_9HYPH|nr:hypothetical protein [Phyllobacterium zundukense]ATU91172.1 hypothetical protein BLM14_05640 [Phyllobacterium zundukense]PIO45859.1 hypothetical protein B5P45_04795 [Phyllobacterium zundukense]
MTRWTLAEYRRQRRIDEAFDPETEGYDPCAVMFEGVVMTKHEKAELMRERRLNVERDARIETWFRRLLPVLVAVIAVAITLIWNLGAGLLVSALVAFLVLRTRRRLIRQGSWSANTTGLWE